MKDYYIYWHRDNKTGNVFYVGMADKKCYEHPYHRAFTFRKKERNNKWYEKFIKCTKGVSVEIIEEHTSEAKCKEREIYFIAHFRNILPKNDSLTNIAEGGDYRRAPGRKVLQYSIGGEFIKEHKDINEAKSVTTVSLKALYQSLSTNNSTCGGYMWKWKEGDKIKPKILPFKNKRIDKQRMVLVYKNGILINTFNSVNEASKKLNADTSSIFKCLKGERKQCKGYTFETK